MITKDDVLSLAYLKKTDYTGSHQGIRYRMECITVDEEKQLQVTVWPEPFNFIKTKDELKKRNTFDFSQDGITDAIAWMNDCLFDMQK